MNRLHAKEMISDPVCKAKSVVFTEVVFTEEGQRRAEQLLHELFARR